MAESGFEGGSYMADLNSVGKAVVEQLFTEMAGNYCSKRLEDILAHYTRGESLQFWNAEGGVITTQQQLQRWYEELFSQFDIQDVHYRIESLVVDEHMMASTSLWVFSTFRKQGEELIAEEQTLRATHLIQQEQGKWVITHLHASPAQHSTD